MRRAITLGAILAAACVDGPAKKPSAAPAPFRVARPGVPWPRDRPACVLTTEAASVDRSNCSLITFDVTRSIDGATIAHFTSIYGRGDVRWKDLPRLGAPRWARVEAGGEGLHVEGFSRLDEHLFELKRRVDLVRDHAWLPARSEVSLLGTAGDRLVISARTSFKAPSTVETTVPCDAFVEAAPPRTPRATAPSRSGAHEAWAVSTRAVLSLRAVPNGHVLFDFEPYPMQAFVLLETRRDYARIATVEAPLAIDGWVESAAVRAVPPVTPDRDFGDCNDTTDGCYEMFAARRAPVFVGADGPIGAAIGVIDRGTPVLVDRSRSGFVAFRMVDRATPVLAAPKGQSFWLRGEDLGRGDTCGSAAADPSP